MAKIKAKLAKITAPASLINGMSSTSADPSRNSSPATGSTAIGSIRARPSFCRPPRTFRSLTDPSSVVKPIFVPPRCALDCDCQRFGLRLFASLFADDKGDQDHSRERQRSRRSGDKGPESPRWDQTAAAGLWDSQARPSRFRQAPQR